MTTKSLTALVSAFARAYHAEQNQVKVFHDSIARQLLSEQEYGNISENMSKAIGFINRQFSGTEQEALRLVVDNQLAPSPLGRAAFTEHALECAALLGVSQYLIFAAGYDSFAYRQPPWASGLHIFELDHPATAADKQQRIHALQLKVPDNLSCIPADFNEHDWQQGLLAHSSYDRSARSFVSLLGISYYLPKESFKQLLSTIADIIPSGSSLVFDYPDELTFTTIASDQVQLQVTMAARAGEPMQASYAYRELEKLLEQAGWLIYEHLTPDEITEQFFKQYNEANPEHPITAFDNVNYCLAVKH